MIYAHFWKPIKPNIGICLHDLTEEKLKETANTNLSILEEAFPVHLGSDNPFRMPVTYLTEKWLSRRVILIKNESPNEQKEF